MSKIGRKPIDVSNLQIDVKGSEVHFKGPKASGVYTLPDQFQASVVDSKLTILPRKEGAKTTRQREINREWGLHRALLSNELTGAQKEFETLVEIVGLGYKGVVSGNKIVFTIGYSHKIDFEIPKGVSVAVDKTGQKLTLTSANKELLGAVCSEICALRRPEPYKGTGIKLANQYIVRKAAKGK